MSTEKKKVKVIEYLDGFTIDEEGIALPVKKNEVIVMSNTRRYYNCLYMLAGIKLLSRTLMDWLTEEMNDDNIVYNTEYSRQRFIKFISDITNGKQVYQHQSIRQAFVDLKEAGLLIQKNKGAYRVHPKFFFKGSETDRMELIMFEIKMSATSTNFKVLPYKK